MVAYTMLLLEIWPSPFTSGMDHHYGTIVDEFALIYRTMHYRTVIVFRRFMAFVYDTEKNHCKSFSAADRV